MRNLFRLLMLAALVASAVPTWGAEPPRIRAGDLRSQGVDLLTFQPIAFTDNGRTLVAREKAPFEDKKKGITYRLWVLALSADGMLDGIRGIDLSIPSFEQAALTPDEGSLVVITRSGATYLRVELATGKIHTLMEHVKGKPGFRADPTVLWAHRGKLLTTGYFYDDKDFAGQNVIATIDLAKQGVDAFAEGPNVEKLERGVEGLQFLNYNSDTLGWFGAKRGDDIALMKWQDGKMVEIDRAPSYAALWGAASRVLFSATRLGGSSELVLYDGDFDRRWLLGTHQNPYRYVFISKDGSTVIACQFSIDAGKMDVYYAKERDDFKLVPVGGLSQVKMGWLRVAPNGRYLALYNEEGLTVAELP